MPPACDLGEAMTWSGLHDAVFELCVKMYVFSMISALFGL